MSDNNAKGGTLSKNLKGIIDQHYDAMKGIAGFYDEVEKS